ncbi:MAG: hypothetical protein ACXVW4_01845 [Nocardioides sp.]
MTRPLPATLVALVVGVLSLAGCSATPQTTETSRTATETPSPTASAAPAWNPCSDLSAARVGSALGARVRKTTGTPDNPRCAFLPVAKGGPTLNVTYLEFHGDFERAFRSMGRLAGHVERLDLPGAKAARLVVNTSHRASLVTGFVQVHGLIETVNAAQLAPYDAGAVRAATLDVLEALVRHAPAAAG